MTCRGWRGFSAFPFWQSGLGKIPPWKLKNKQHQTPMWFCPCFTGRINPATTPRSRGFHNGSSRLFQVRADG